MPRLGLLAALSILAACGGDPRDAFVGTWNTSNTITLTISGQSQTTQGTGGMSISRGSAPDEITWQSPACTYTATVTSDSSFILKPVVCQPQDSGDCKQVVYSFKQGTGTRTGTSINLTASGDVSGVCGGQSVKGTFTATWAGSKS